MEALTENLARFIIDFFETYGIFTESFEIVRYFIGCVYITVDELDKSTKKKLTPKMIVENLNDLFEQRYYENCPEEYKYTIPLPSNRITEMYIKLQLLMKLTKFEKFLKNKMVAVIREFDEYTPELFRGLYVKKNEDCEFDDESTRTDLHIGKQLGYRVCELSHRVNNRSLNVYHPVQELISLVTKHNSIFRDRNVGSDYVYLDRERFEFNYPLVNKRKINRGQEFVYRVYGNDFDPIELFFKFVERYLEM